MASVSGVTSSNANGIYGSRNVFSGMASGMDTESMIENAVSGLQARITQLQQSKTKTQWKMEAYRNLTDAMVQFTRKYTSYTSATNLMSASFFNKAVLTSAQGANKDFITASGKSSSEIQINGVQRLAGAARYTTDGGVLAGHRGDAVVTGEDILNLGGKTDLSNLTGNLSFTYGTKTVSISFDETEAYKNIDELSAAITDKLKEQKVTVGDKTYSADQLIQVKTEDGKISFSDAKNGGNSVYISGASSTIGKALELGDLGDKDNRVTSFSVHEDKLYREVQTAEYLSGKSMTVSLNGVNKKITLPEIEVEKDADGNATKYTIGGEDFELDGDGNVTNKDGFHDAYLGALNTSLEDAFGAGKVVASLNADRLEFTAEGQGNVLSISSSVGDVLGLGGTSASSYLDTGKTLKDLLGEDVFRASNRAGAVGDVKKIEGKDETGDYYVDAEGKKVARDGDSGPYYRVDEKGEYLYDLEINGKSVGQYSRNTALESVLRDINNNADAGVNVSYSKVSNQFVFTAKETGSAGRIEYENDSLAGALFGNMKESDGSLTADAAGNYTAGQDAKVSVSIDGNNMVLERGTNNFDLDGLSVTLKGTFNSDTADLYKKVDTDADGEALKAAVDGLDADKKVAFKTEADADKIVDAVKSMIEDYNAMITGVKEAYSTMPSYKYANSGERYEPLTDADMEGMSESAIKAYEEKAKQGLLFGDSDLSSMYNKLRDVFAPSGNDGSYLRSIGVTTNYSNGLTTIELDETKLRDALTADPDKVRDAFTKTADTDGSGVDGVMQRLNSTLKSYAGTEGAAKGILINKAGSKYAALSLMDNSLQSNVDDIEDQIAKWQDKISTKVDYYTRKFSAMEQLVAQMNSQSSYLQGMMSGGS